MSYFRKIFEQTLKETKINVGKHQIVYYEKDTNIKNFVKFLKNYLIGQDETESEYFQNPEKFGLEKIETINSSFAGTGTWIYHFKGNKYEDYVSGGRKGFYNLIHNIKKL